MRDEAFLLANLPGVRSFRRRSIHSGRFRRPRLRLRWHGFFEGGGEEITRGFTYVSPDYPRLTLAEEESDRARELFLR